MRLLIALLSSVSVVLAARVIEFDFASGKPAPFYKPWEAAVGSGHAKLALRDDWQQALLEVKKSVDFKRVRFHGLLDDDMGLVRSGTTAIGPEGHPIQTSTKYTLNFTKIQTVFDFLVYEAKMAPYIELSFMPGLLASGSTTYLHYKARTDPPKNFSDWGNVIYRLASFLVERYGIDTVSTWYFEVWNEPNLKNPLPRIVGEFWTGTQLEYYELFATTSRALKSVSETLSVGGPVTSGTPAWIGDFLKYCRVHNVSVDFVSSHSYPSASDVDFLVKSINASTELARAAGKPFFLSEFNSGLFFDCCHDRAYAAAFLVHTALSLQFVPAPNSPGGCRIGHFSDIFEELYMDTVPFHNGYGLTTVDGIPKPALRAFELLGNFPGEFYGIARADNSSPGNLRGFSGIVTKNASDLHFQTLLTQFMPSKKGEDIVQDLNVTVEYTLSRADPIRKPQRTCVLNVGYIDQKANKSFHCLEKPWLAKPNVGRRETCRSECL